MHKHADFVIKEGHDEYHSIRRLAILWPWREKDTHQLGLCREEVHRFLGRLTTPGGPPVTFHATDNRDDVPKGQRFITLRYPNGQIAGYDDFGSVMIRRGIRGRWQPVTLLRSVHSYLHRWFRRAEEIYVWTEVKS